MKKILICVGVIAFSTEASLGQGATNAFIEMVRDINVDGPSSPANFVSSQNAVYFFADDGAGNGSELWFTQGSSNTTHKANIDAVQGSVVASGPDVYMLTEDGGTTSLWSSVSAITNNYIPLASSVNISSMTPWSKDLLYVNNHTELFIRSSTNNPIMVTNMVAISEIVSLIDIGTSNYLVVSKDDFNSYSVYSGTESNITTVYGGGISGFEVNETAWISSKKEFYFSAQHQGNQRLMMLDFKNLGAGPTNIAPNVENPVSLTVVGSALFFRSGNSIYRKSGADLSELSYDGLSGDIGLEDVHSLTSVGEDLFFAAADIDTDIFGKELWRCSSTANNPDAFCIDINPVITTNTVGQLEDIVALGSTPANLYEFNGQLIFTAELNDGMRSLWIYRDSDELQLRGDVQDLESFDSFTGLGSFLYFSATGPAENELWKFTGNGRFEPLGKLLNCPTEDDPAWDPYIEYSEVDPQQYHGSSNTERPIPVAKVVTLASDNSKRVLFTDPGGKCTIVWTNSTTITNEFPDIQRWDYEVLGSVDEAGVDNTKLIYHTEDASRAPKVDFSNVPYNPIPCENSRVLVAGEKYVSQELPIDIGVGNPVTNELGEVRVTWSGNVWLDENGGMHADIYDDTTGFPAVGNPFVLVFEDGDGNYLSNEVVRVLPYIFGAPKDILIGDEIEAESELDNGLPYVSSGKMESRDDDGYIYQHLDQGDLEGQVYTVRRNSNNELNMEVFWMRDGLYEVAWPYQKIRYLSEWPTNSAQRLIRRSDSIEPRVAIPSELNPYKMPEEQYGEFSHGYMEGGEFYSDGAGFSLILLESGPAQRRDWLEFVAVKSVMNTEVDEFTYSSVSNMFGIGTNTFFNRTPTNWPIGEVIVDDYHVGANSGYIYYNNLNLKGDYFHPDFYGSANAQSMHSGDIFSVNEGTLEVWWSNETHTNVAEHGVSDASIQWPSYVMVYSNLWPHEYTGTIEHEINDVIIASEQGVEAPDLDRDLWEVYYQNDTDAVGFNPNDEHAYVYLGNDGEEVHPLRCDLDREGELDTSKPNLVIENLTKTNSFGEYVNDLDIYRVVASNETYAFYSPAASNVVGGLAHVPVPLETGTLGICDLTQVPGSNYLYSALWRDRKKWHWVRASDSDLENTMHFHYKLQPGFHFPRWYHAAIAGNTKILSSAGNESILDEGDEVPWLDVLDGTTNTIGIPIDYTYSFSLPDRIPVLAMGQTLTKSLRDFVDEADLPSVWNQRSVEVIYQEANYTNSIFSTNTLSVSLIDPIAERKVAFTEHSFTLSKKLADGLKQNLLQIVNGKSIFKDLPSHLQKRLIYDEIQGTGYLRFSGRLMEPPAGHYLLLNSINAADHYTLTNTFSSVYTAAGAGDDNSIQFTATLDSLIETLFIIDKIKPDIPFANLALSTGPATHGGLVVFSVNNSTTNILNDPGDPIELFVLSVTNALYPGQIIAIDSDNGFDENLVLRHTADFGGEGEFIYEWKHLPTLLEPAITTPSDTNKPSNALWQDSSPLYVDSTLGTNRMSLIVGGLPQFVLEDNFFTCHYTPAHSNHPLWGTWSDWVSPPGFAPNWVKRVMDKINPYEQRVKTFDSYAPSTLATMLEQVGIAHNGAVPLNQDAVDDYGLIQIYETVFDRALKLGENDLSNTNIANTILLAAGRLADLYMILGNEAYADAQDPTIGFGTEHGDYGSEASSIFCFQNFLPSLLDEELALLRGRDGSGSPGINAEPFFNRLPWNMSWDISGGEVAYALNYEITDVANKDGQRTEDGLIDAFDAAKLYPQGHGDAWGHYLSAISYYYRLLHAQGYDWQPRAESIPVAGFTYQVDFLDERKFAKTAVARARTGNELVGLTHRAEYSTDPAARLSGYADSDGTNRCWGVNGWASRVGQGAYFDWIVGNSMLPTNSVKSGLEKVDRTTVLELGEIARIGHEVQQKLDAADQGLNPLGLAGNVVPFDISPTAIDQGQAHYEQIYGRAVTALNNAKTVFDHAQNSSQQLRRQFDSHEDFVNTVQEREFDFENRLIELYGYPYGSDIGPGKTYSQGYEGPDYYHYNYVDLTKLLGVVRDVRLTNVTVEVEYVSAGGSVESSNKTYAIHYTGDLNFWEIKPNDWTIARRAPGEIQMARGDIIQAIGRYLRAEIEYGNLLAQIDDQVELLQLQYGINAQEILILNQTKNTQERLNTKISRLRTQQTILRKVAEYLPRLSNAASEAVPKVIGAIFGFSNGFIADYLGGARAGIQASGITAADVLNGAASLLGSVEQNTSQAKEIVSLESNIKVTTLRQGLSELQALKQLEQLVRSEASARLGLFTEIETIEQAAGRYYSSIMKAKRIEAERLRFRRQAAGQIQDYRYKDAAFRIFRNDALQRYRAQFDLAARYAYMAARTYGYETCLLDEEHAGDFGSNKLEEQIVKARTIGYMANNQPVWGTDAGGLAEALGELNLNWFVVGPQFGFDNPQTETGRFSLRQELFRILPGNNGDETWRETLQSYVVDNIRDIPEFNKYCIPFNPMQEEEPGIVIPFSSTVNFGHNFFGWLAGGGDNSYDSANFATKIRSVGIWFSNYNNIQGGGLINTPRVYLVPVGSDIMRRPLGDRGDIVEFNILDQALPIPLTIGGSELSDPSYLPMHDMGSDSMAQPRRHGTVRAYHDAGVFNDAETMNNSRLVGRSVWNTQWMLIIPAGTLHSDREEGLKRFIEGGLLNGDARDLEGVKDIKLFFQTYATEGQ